MINPTFLAAQAIFKFTQLAHNLVAARQTCNKAGGPIEIRSKPVEEKIKRPEIDDGCVGCEHRFEHLGPIEIEGEPVFCPVLQGEPKLAATAVIVILTHLFGADDTTGRRPGKSPHG
jgi:hypothetical protein